MAEGGNLHALVYEYGHGPARGNEGDFVVDRTDDTRLELGCISWLVFWGAHIFDFLILSKRGMVFARISSGIYIHLVTFHFIVVIYIHSIILKVSQ